MRYPDYRLRGPVLCNGHTEASGTIFHIMRFSVHDGPGIRTAMFFKGCPLSCWWCHNPESQNFEPEVLYSAERCRLCGDCAATCPHGAIERIGGQVAAQSPHNLQRSTE